MTVAAAENAPAVQQQQQEEARGFVPTEEYFKHAEMILNHEHWKDMGISEEHVEEFNSVFKAILCCEGFMNEDSFNLIFEYLTEKASEYLVFALPTANSLRDGLKSTIESFRDCHKGLCVIEESGPSAVPIPEGLKAEEVMSTVKTIKGDNVAKAIEICNKWSNFNKKLLDKSHQFSEKIANVEGFKDLHTTLKLTVSSLNRNIADICRYEYELTLDPKSLEEAEKHYVASIELSKNEYPAELNPCYLSSILNYSVCLYDCREDHDTALKTIQKVYERAFKISKELGELLTPALTMAIEVLMQVIIYNMQAWVGQKQRAQRSDMSDENDCEDAASSEASLNKEENDE